jgi:GntP family gluconate:H+ symporter
MHPILILLIGTAVVVVCIIKLRIGAFFGLILAALLVSLLAPGELGEKITRVVEAFGVTAGKIGLIIACAAVIGKCMTESGAADRIVRGFLNLFGQKRAPVALAGSGFVLSVPVFFDTVFYLLVPLARSLYRSTQKHYLLYILAIAVGGVVTHSLVPPTPGPVAMAADLHFELGMMIMMGTLVAIPCAVAGLMFAAWAQKRMNIPMRAIAGENGEDDLATNSEDRPLPKLFGSLLPVVLPVVLISANTIVGVLAKKAEADPKAAIHGFHRLTSLFGNPNIALLIAAACALLLYIRQRRPSREVIGQSVEGALMSAGIIILITSAGGAFGAMLKEAQVGPVIESWFSGEQGASGIALILMAWSMSVLLKTCQGSGTVAMITTAPIMAAMIEGQTLSIHPVYLALAIGCGSVFVSWMNDSAFWIVSRMSGLTEMETLKTWTVALAVISVTGLLVTVLLASVFPMPL